jgi:hypothetical protein
MIQDTPQSIDPNYGFEILKTLERGLTQWSIVIDMKQGRVYFRTSEGRKTKYFDMDHIDFSSDTPVKVLDINARLNGDIFDYFVDYSPKRNLRAAKEGIESTDSYEQGLSRSLEQHGYNLDDLINRVCIVANNGSCDSPLISNSESKGNDTIAEDALSKPGRKNSWILPLGAFLILLLIAALLLAYRKRRRKNYG